MDLWTHVSSVPNCFRRVSDIVCDGKSPDYSVIRQLETKLLQCRSCLYLWRKQLEDQCWQMQQIEVAHQVGGDERFKILGICISNLIILDRLLVALQPFAKGALSHEANARLLASEMERIERSAVEANARADLFMALKTHVAKSVLETATVWKEYLESQGNVIQTRTGPISRGIFNEWCGILRKEIKWM
jgi:hypothetical protein